MPSAPTVEINHTVPQGLAGQYNHTWIGVCTTSVTLSSVVFISIALCVTVPPSVMLPWLVTVSLAVSDCGCVKGNESVKVHVSQENYYEKSLLWG